MKRKGGPSAGRKADKGGSSKGAAGVGKHKKNKKQGSKPQQLRDVPLPEEEQQLAASDVEVSDEDIEFVQQHTQRLGFLKNLDAKALDKSVKQAQKRDMQKQQAATATAGQGDEEDEEGEEAGQGDDVQPAPQQRARGRLGVDEEDEEQGVEAYERAPRVDKSAVAGPKGRGLPVKTLEGALMYDKSEQEGGKGLRRGLAALPRASDAPQVEGVIVEDELEATIKKRQEESEQKAALAAQEAAKQQAKKAKAAAEVALLPALAALRQLQDKEQRRVRAREAMAVSANKLLSGPEEAVGEFKVLLELAKDNDMQVSRLALLSLMAVFKDIMPGYRIRPPTEKELQVKVSKEVQKMRDYESALLRHYQTYLKHLVAAVKPAAQDRAKGHGSKQGDTAASRHVVTHARVAVKCMCQLLTTLPHFNYASDLLQAVVPHMASHDPETRALACGALHGLLASHESHAKLALEAVQLVADLVRTKKCVCPAEVVQVLSVLRFTEIRPRSEEHQDGQKNKKKDNGKKGQAKRARTEIDAEVDRDFKEADAGPDLRLAAMVQSQMLEALFETYFRVLKACTSSPPLLNDPQIESNTNQHASTVPNGAVTVAVAAAQSGPGLQSGGSKHKSKHKGAAAGGGTGEVVGAVAPGLGAARERVLARHPLLYAALEGLGRYAHLISVDYFTDIMEVFHQLLRSPGLPLVERLRVLLTASNILRGQGEALNIDRRELNNQLYASLLMVPMQGTADVPPYPSAAMIKLLQQATAQTVGKARAHLDTPEGGWDGTGDEELDHPSTAALAAVLQKAVVSGAAVDQADQVGTELVGEASATHRVEEPVAVLMGAVLGQMLCEPKVTDMSRLAAFVKRGVAIASQAPTPETITILGCCMRLLRRYPRLQLLLEWEGEAPVAGRSWLRDCPDPSEAGALSSCLWELPLLALHYHPHIAQAANSILTTCSPTASASGQQLSGPLALPGTLRDLAAAYSHIASGSFHPAPPAPSKKQHANAPTKRLLYAPATEDCEEMLAEFGVSLSAQQQGSAAVQGADDDEGMGSDSVGGEDGYRAVQQDEESLVAAGLQQQYRLIRRHEVNQLLRQEQARLIGQIQRFQVHLHERELQRKQQKQMQRQHEAHPQAQQQQGNHKQQTGVSRTAGAPHQSGKDNAALGKRLAATNGARQAKQRRL